MKVKDIIIATQRIKDYPDSHGYSEAEVRDIQEFNIKMDEFSSKIQRSIVQVAEKLKQAWEPAQKAVEEINRRLIELSYFSEYGWLIGFNVFRNYPLSEIFRVSRLQDKEKVDEFFLNLFNENEEYLFRYFIKKHSKRESQFLELKKGYKHQLYSSVVILAYSIADGITNETLGFGFFDTKEGKGSDERTLKVKLHIDKDSGLLNSIASHALTKRNEINRYYDVKNHPIPIDSYNRHLVIHGHSYNYGSRINAVRAILMLDFVIYLFDFTDSNS